MKEVEYEHLSRDQLIHNKTSLKKLIAVAVVCTCFMGVELVGGLYSNSLAILTDAAHLLSDLCSFMLSAASLYLAQKAANERMTFGYHRAEILGALLSINFIWVLTVWLLMEAAHRVLHPREVNAELMVGVALFGLCCNIVMMKLLHSVPHQHEHSHLKGNINVRAALIHILGDLIQSVGVLVASIVIYIDGDLTIVDPICTFGFSIIVICTTVPIMRDCVSIVMHEVPGHIDYSLLKRDLSGITGVSEVHDLRIWSLSTDKHMASCHLISDDPVSVLILATQICKRDYLISEVTVQVEASSNESLNCSSSI